jgi:hypothetical protein
LYSDYTIVNYDCIAINLNIKLEPIKSATNETSLEYAYKLQTNLAKWGFITAESTIYYTGLLAYNSYEYMYKYIQNIQNISKMPNTTHILYNIFSIDLYQYEIKKSQEVLQNTQFMQHALIRYGIHLPNSIQYLVSCNLQIFNENLV